MEIQLQPTTVEMVQKSHLSFLGRRSFAPRPLSQATEFFDTDNEEELDDGTPRSSGSFGASSQSTISTHEEVRTPLTGGLGGFEFHFDDKPVLGPVGPHLFRGTPEILDLDDQQPYLEMSPIAEPKTRARPIETLNVAVAELNEAQAREWSSYQVADWMSQVGFDASVVEKFLIHDISGDILLDLQSEDLKELDISSFGKRHRVMSQIKHLRNSSMFSIEAPLSRTPSKTSRSPRAVHRPAKAEERVITTSRSRSRSGRHTRNNSSADVVVTPAESVSIVAIEQLLPKPHKCSKGEDCPKWKKYQKKIQALQEEFPEQRILPESIDMPLPSPSIVAPSVVASSDVLGPHPTHTITEALLCDVQQRDPQESVRQFLSFQHLHGTSAVNNPSPPPAASASFSPKTAQLPKLTIPLVSAPSDSRYPTPVSAFRLPSQIQAQQKLSEDPYHYGGVASPVDVYRVGTPFSMTDVPVTAMPIDPCQRDASQSVPPDMRYGTTPTFGAEPIERSASVQPESARRQRRRPSFTPTIAPVREVNSSGVQPPTVSELELANHAGWMRKRKTTKFLRHEWADNYFTLEGTTLAMLKDDADTARPIELIDVDDYSLHAYTAAASSKLSSAFKKSLLGNGKALTNEPGFAFTLLPEAEKNKKLFEKTKSHHFAVQTGKDRVEWMRKLMLAKALKKNDTCQI